MVGSLSLCSWTDCSMVIKTLHIVEGLPEHTTCFRLGSLPVLSLACGCGDHTQSCRGARCLLWLAPLRGCWQWGWLARQWWKAGLQCLLHCYALGFSVGHGCSCLSRCWHFSWVTIVAATLEGFVKISWSHSAANASPAAPCMFISINIVRTVRRSNSAKANQQSSTQTATKNLFSFLISPRIHMFIKMLKSIVSLFS